MINKIKKLSSKKVLSIAVIFLGLTRYYLGPLASISYLISLFYIKYKLKIIDWIFVIYLSLLFIKSTLDFGIYNALLVFGFHWGFIFYFLFFKKYLELINLRSLFFVLSVITIVEGILVNTFLDAKNFPNYPLAEATSHFSSIWQRSYSFGGNASITGVLIISLLTLLPFSKFRLLLASAVMVFSASASGVFSFFIYLGFNFRKFWRWSYIIIIFFVGIIFYILSSKYSSDIGYFSKVSTYYISFLLNDKTERLFASLTSMSLIEHLIGSLNYIDTGGDFTFLNFYKCHGISGILIILGLVLRNLSSKNKLPIFLILFFSFHYHVIFSAPGQVLFGYLLSLKQREKTINN